MTIPRISSRRSGRRVLAAAVVFSAMTSAAVLGQNGKPAAGKAPIVLADQGSFAVGGAVLTNPGTFDPLNPTPAGQTIHGDHAYVQYQIPVKARRLPLVMWHGGGQFSKTWETTPDGREGYQNIFCAAASPPTSSTSHAAAARAAPRNSLRDSLRPDRLASRASSSVSASACGPTTFPACSSRAIQRRSINGGASRCRTRLTWTTTSS